MRRNRELDGIETYYNRMRTDFHPTVENGTERWFEPLKRVISKSPFEESLSTGLVGVAAMTSLLLLLVLIRWKRARKMVTIVRHAVPEKNNLEQEFGAIPDCDCGKCDKPCRRRDFYSRQRIGESVRSGSPFTPVKFETMPKFQCMMYASYSGDVWTHVGTAIRLGDHLVSTQHQIRDYDQMLFTRKPLVEGNPIGVVVKATELLKVLPPAADVVTLRLTEAEFSRIGLSTPRIGGVDSTRTTVALAVTFSSGSKISFGELTRDFIWGQVMYTGSTIAGCSGAAYYVGNLVYGLHLCGGQDNLGYSASYLMSLLKTQEETAEWLEQLFRTNKRARWKFEPARSAYSIYDGYQFHSVDEDVFDDWMEKQERWESDHADEGWAGEGREYKQGEQAEMLEETAKSLRRRAEKTKAVGLKQYYEQRADEYSSDAFNYQHRLDMEPEGLTTAQKELLPEALRYQVGSAEPAYYDAPDEFKSLEHVEEHVEVLVEAAKVVAKEAISLNEQAVVPDATAEALQQLSRRKEEVLAVMDECMRMAREHQERLRNLYLRQETELQRLKSEPGTIVTQTLLREVTDEKMAVASQLTEVNSQVKEAELLVKQAKVKPKKLKSAAKAKQRVELLDDIMSKNNLDLQQMLRMVVSAGGLSIAGSREILAGAGLQVMPVLVDAKSQEESTSSQTTLKLSLTPPLNESAVAITLPSTSLPKQGSNNSAKVSVTTPRSKPKPGERSSNPAGSKESG
jgi:hypothetical protein